MPTAHPRHASCQRSRGAMGEVWCRIRLSCTGTRLDHCPHSGTGKCGGEVAPAAPDGGPRLAPIDRGGQAQGELLRLFTPPSTTAACSTRGSCAASGAQVWLATSTAGARRTMRRARLPRRRSGRRPARSSRAALAPTLARTSVRCETARLQSQAAALWPSPCSLVAGCAGSYAGAHLCKVRGCTCAVLGGGALAVAVLARRGMRWLLRWRAPL